MEIRYRINSRLLLLLMLGVIMSCTSYLMFVYQPLHLIIRKIANLTPGSLYLSLWSVPPSEVLIEVYIFNITNSDAFLEGSEKMNVTEVGPYVYQELLFNNNATFNDNGTMTFWPIRHLRFRSELSVGNPDEDRVISSNIPLIAMMGSLQNASMFTNLAIASLSNMVGSTSFINITISEYLWGYEDRLITLGHQTLPAMVPFEKFGIFDQLMKIDNASNVVTINVHPELGLASSILSEMERSRKYHIHRWNGSPGLQNWGYVDNADDTTPPKENSRCNMVEGTFDGTIFPPRMNTSVKVFRRSFCRPVPFEPVGEGNTADGFDVTIYKIDKRFLVGPEENPDNHCYCTRGECRRRGLASLGACFSDMPIAISLPHFLDADPSLLDEVDGMKPNGSIHVSSFSMQPDLGIVLEANLAIQLNLDIGETRFNPITKPFNGMVLPLFWVKLTAPRLTPFVYTLLYLAFCLGPVLQNVLIFVLCIGGLAVISGSALFYLFVSKEEPNGRLSFRGDYRPIPIIPINASYFKPDFRILK